ncbi:HAMP domain-containing histidine kinase [Syntrophus gentianae]|uniref:HAMP domain-containing histidine kinase n=1 Tax=Syntrophus gentianae TaxID=43775 RepID=UPI0011138E2B|nr:HAMP domain-containing histidine kinase [Syntrophus gentianae]
MSTEKTNLEITHKALEREFESTFINELMPGILHNFANPLNGIMGRSKLLQRRMDVYFQNIQSNHPELMAHLEDEKNKLINDVSSICKESDRFYYLFQDLSTKFYAIADRRFDQINVETLLKNEIRFLDFYLDFKHEIKKIIKPVSGLPYIYGIPSDYSYCFSALIRNAMVRMKKSNRKELSIEFEHSNNMITVLLQDTGEKLVSCNNEDIMLSDQISAPEASVDNLAVVKALFKEYHVNCTFEAMEEMNRITVEIPVTKEKKTHD